MLTSSKVRRLIVKEEMLDYIVQMPWYIPPAARGPRETAQKLLPQLRTHMEVPVPKLANICRAKLAKVHYGLQKVIQTKPDVLFKEMYPTSRPLDRVATAAGPRSAESLVYVIAIQ